MAKTRKRRGMRNPNGYGSVSNIGGNRRRPWRVRITTGWEYNEETGRAKQLTATIGYYATRQEAMIALAEYNKDPYDLDADKVTFEEAYNAWFKAESDNVGPSRQAQLRAAFAKCEPIYKIRMKDLKKKQLQDLLDKHSHLSDTAQNNIKSVFKGAFKFCMENDIVSKDYSAFTKIKAPEKESIHKPFTAEEISLLWDNLDFDAPLSYGKKEKRSNYPVDTILMLIYTGMRPSELLNMKCENVNLEERYMVGGSKTDAGKNRIIPIHDDIFPLVEKRVKTGYVYLIPYKIDKPPTLSQYREFFFNPVMDKLKVDHLPHDGRHTFATMADRYEMKKLFIKLIMGHATKSDITEGVYTHKTATELVEAVNKITFLEK